MKSPFNFRAASFDADAINETIRNALASAGLSTTSGPMRTVTDTIRRALQASSMPATRGDEPARTDVIDVVARVVERVDEKQQHASVRQPEQSSLDKPQSPVSSFDTFEYANGAGQRAYKLYVPARIEASPPLVVMLHGCTQSADDFASGTRMNRLADEHGFLVVYPEQAGSANPSKCWNWFKAQDQVRDSGEPSLIAGIVREVAAGLGVDTRRIFVAGLSAGGAMAVILGETYPDLFSGVGVHSGLPYGSAHDIPSAMAAMKGGLGRSASPKSAPRQDKTARSHTAQAVPTIVFHGDRDHTVQQANGSEIVRQAIDAHAASNVDMPISQSLHSGTSPGGRKFGRTVYGDAAGRPCVESWTVHGAGHAWSGGSASGSYTDASGPDASAEMVRFFLSLSPAVA